ncbi:hypothetical protein ABZV14_05780 [Streptosporangium canum]|uniref:hypothetical protein n=1 Tax=Streptosporangium canum TaxID=324952 RepID=UPI0033ACFD81
MLDLWRRKLSFRRLSFLARQLLSMPGESALSKAKFGESASWSDTQYMLAELNDRLAYNSWVFIEANKAEGADNPYPDPFPRPGRTRKEVSEEPQEQEFASPHEVVAFFARLQSRQG